MSSREKKLTKEERIQKAKEVLNSEEFAEPCSPTRKAIMYKERQFERDYPNISIKKLCELVGCTTTRYYRKLEILKNGFEYEDEARFHTFNTSERILLISSFVAAAERGECICLDKAIEIGNKLIGLRDPAFQMGRSLSKTTMRRWVRKQNLEVSRAVKESVQDVPSRLTMMRLFLNFIFWRRKTIPEISSSIWMRCFFQRSLSFLRGLLFTQVIFLLCACILQTVRLSHWLWRCRQMVMSWCPLLFLLFASTNSSWSSILSTILFVSSSHPVSWLETSSSDGSRKCCTLTLSPEEKTRINMPYWFVVPIPPAPTLLSLRCWSRRTSICWFFLPMPWAESSRSLSVFFHLSTRSLIVFTREAERLLPFLHMQPIRSKGQQLQRI